MLAMRIHVLAIPPVVSFATVEIELPYGFQLKKIMSAVYNESGVGIVVLSDTAQPVSVERFVITRTDFDLRTVFSPTDHWQYCDTTPEGLHLFLMETALQRDQRRAMETAMARAQLAGPPQGLILPN